MEIRAVPGHEVPIYKIQDFIVTARDLGYPIAMITTDGYQSTNLRQNLMLKGFTTDLVSVDRTKDPYNNLRNIILEGRLQAPNLEKLKREVRDLEELDQKFDHPPDSSKDILDSLCGSIWTCSTNLSKSAGAQNIQNLDTSIRMMSRTGSTNMFKRFENKLLGASR